MNAQDSHTPDKTPITPGNAVLREGAEPVEGAAPINLWFVLLALVLVGWCAGYLALNSGGFQSDVYNANQVSWTGAGAGGPAAAPDPMVIGKRVFSQNCAVCHQATGLGVAGQFPPLAGSEWVLSQDWHGDNHIVKIVLHGLGGPVNVKGAKYNNAMAPWGKVLKDDQIAAVLTYVRNEWGNKAPAITPEFVAKVREDSKARTEPWTENDLKAVGRELVNEAAATPAEAAPAPAAATPGA